MARRQFFGIIFTFLYTVAMLRPLLPIIVYYANYDYIAQELCVNKDKPYLDCNGRCYVEALNKRVNPVENTPIATGINLNDYPISTLDFTFYTSPDTSIEIVHATNYQRDFFIRKGHTRTLLQPPEFVL